MLAPAFLVTFCIIRIAVITSGPVIAVLLV